MVIEQSNVITPPCAGVFPRENGPDARRAHSWRVRPSDTFHDVANDCVTYLRCLFTSFVMSNIDTWPLPPKIGLSLSSALIMRRFFASCRLFFLMYCQSFLVTSVRGIGEAPTTGASCADGVIGFMNAGFGARLVFFAGAFFAAAFFAGAFFAAAFFAPFLAAFFLAVAIDSSPGG